MLTIFGSDVSPLIKFPLFLVAILAIVGAFYVVLRRMTGARLVSSGPEQGRSRQPRLGVVDVYDLDRTRQLVLLRRDNVEHLLLIGGPNDTVIETNIVRITGGKLPVAPDLQFERAEQQAAEPVPTRPLAEHPVRPVIEGAAARPAAVERPVFGETAHAPAPVIPVASPATVSAASFAAVAAATQHEHEAQPTEVPDFLRTPHDHRATDTGTSSDIAAEAGPVRHQPPFTEPEQLPPPHIEFERPSDKSPQLAEPLFPVIPPEAPLHQPEPAKLAELEHIEPFVEREPVHDPEFPTALVPDLAPTPVFEPEAAVPEPAIELEPVSQPETPEHGEEQEHWSKNTPFAGLDSSIRDYSKFPIRLEPHQPEPAETEQAIAPATEHEAVAPAETEHAAAAEAPLHLDEAILSDMARQLEKALASQHAATQEPTPEHPPETEVKSSAHGAEVEEAAVVSHEQDKPVITEPESAIPAPVTTPAFHPVAPPAEPEKTESKPDPESAAKKNDPFSLDDIEAEFARLLGRTDQSGKV